MLVPSGLSKKEREAYDKRHVPKARKLINTGPAGGLRPVGGKEVPAPVKEKTRAKTFGKK